ncbi:sugar transferase [Danxiaibacter flavus]|uniref:Sugar transferase n=1 Tax=Danxiaibacter flavus TaxID=3049108 RepID=A0ABV3Z959_9BACT|nr:sugar transferase [Chitinophagaceae bacterium DXS]
MNGRVEIYNEIIEPVLHKTDDTPALLVLEKPLLPLQKQYNVFLKRAFDIIVSSAAVLFILSWLVPLIACIIKLNSKGPVFFVQKRNKKNGEVFNCIKFRTMVVNADADRKGAYKNDQRITSVGNFFRKTHLDELPQFFNVLRGEMSFVGPRPYMIAENRRNETLIASYKLRHDVKPGITGLAQSLGHYGFTEDANMLKARLDMDLHYIYHWSLKMDMTIILRTFINLFR